MFIYIHKYIRILVFNMYIYILTQTYICIYIYMHIFLIYIHIYINILIFIYLHIYMQYGKYDMLTYISIYDRFGTHPSSIYSRTCHEGVEKTWVYPHCSCTFDCQTVTPHELVDTQL